MEHGSGIILNNKQNGGNTPRDDKENFETINEFVNATPLLAGQFKSFEIDVTNTSSTIKFRHEMSFKPMDVFVSWVNPSSTIVIKYDLIDEEFLAFTSSAACKLRLIAGRIP